MSKTWKNNVKVVKKSNLKQRLELKLTALVVKKFCPDFQNLAPPGKFRVGGAATSSPNLLVTHSNKNFAQLRSGEYVESLMQNKFETVWLKEPNTG